jgi:hypothetical protein
MGDKSMSKSNEILVYITADKNRVMGGNPLILIIKDVEEQKKLSVELGRTLRANVIQLKNDDYIIIST